MIVNACCQAAAAQPVGFWSWPGWGAFEAVGSMGALFVAIWLASQASRDARRRDAAVLKSLLFPIATVEARYAKELELVAEGKTTALAAYKHFKEDPLQTDIANMLRSMRGWLMPSTEAIDIWVSAINLLEGKTKHARATVKDERSALALLQFNDAYLKRMCRLLSEQIRTLGGTPDIFDDLTVNRWVAHANPGRLTIQTLPAHIAARWQRRPGWLGGTTVPVRAAQVEPFDPDGK